MLFAESFPDSSFLLITLFLIAIECNGFERTRAMVNSDPQPKNYDEQRQHRYGDGTTKGEEGKGEKEGWRAGDAKGERRREKEERNATLG
jgi:hypothetical protein